MSAPLPSRRATVLVFVLTLVSYAYFYQGGGPNQFSRLALAAALGEEGTVRIDTFHQLTFDKAFKDGHFYCDKAPGLSLLAAPVYAVVRRLLDLSPGLGARERLNLVLYLLTLLTVSLPVALAVAAFFRRVFAEAGPRAAFWVTVALGLGSPLAVYASLFYGHAVSAALCWFAFVLVAPSPAAPVPPGGLPRRRFLLGGLLAGWATLTELPVVLITAALFVHVCLSQPRFWRPALMYVAGGVPALLILLGYNVAAFGQPFANGYQYSYLEVFREQMSRGLMGVTGPSLAATVGILFSRYRGLLFFWPFFMLCVVPAFVLLIARGRLRGPTLLAACIVAVYLLFGCSYYLWTGGASFGPRHLVPCLPFAAYLAGRAYEGAVRWLAPVAAVLSVAVVVISVATLAEFPEEIRNPLFGFAWPQFRAGNLSLKVLGPEGRILVPEGVLSPADPGFHDACNLGELFGLRGLVSLLPLAAVMLPLAGALWWLSAKRAGSADDRSRAGETAGIPE